MNWKKYEFFDLTLELRILNRLMLSAEKKRFRKVKFLKSVRNKENLFLRKDKVC